MTALHMDNLAAGSITSTLRPLCRKDGTFDLVDTRRHNVIEHDSSFTRLDFRQGDNHSNGCGASLYSQEPCREKEALARLRAKAVAKHFSTSRGNDVSPFGSVQRKLVAGANSQSVHVTKPSIFRSWRATQAHQLIARGSVPKVIEVLDGLRQHHPLRPIEDSTPVTTTGNDSLESLGHIGHDVWHRPSAGFQMPSCSSWLVGTGLLPWTSNHKSGLIT